MRKVVTLVCMIAVAVCWTAIVVIAVVKISAWLL